MKNGAHCTDCLSSAALFLPPPTQVMDKHLAVLAGRHLETKFIRVHAEKAPFLTGRCRLCALMWLAAFAPFCCSGGHQRLAGVGACCTMAHDVVNAVCAGRHTHPPTRHPPTHPHSE